jgi:hypothetical protein
LSVIGDEPECMAVIEWLRNSSDAGAPLFSRPRHLGSDVRRASQSEDDAISDVFSFTIHDQQSSLASPESS